MSQGSFFDAVQDQLFDAPAVQRAPSAPVGPSLEEQSVAAQEVHDLWAERLTGPREVMAPIDVAHAALLEAGRGDLAECVIGFEDEDGFYLELFDDLTTKADLVVVDRAEAMARRSVGLEPRER
jgi:hypothetical protein